MSEENEDILAEIDRLEPEGGAIFIKPRKKYSEKRICYQCGIKYILGTPYEECQPGIRDLCDECIAKLPKTRMD